MKEVYARREAIVAALLGLALVIVIWGPVLLRPFGRVPSVESQTLGPHDERRPTPARSSSLPARAGKVKPTGPVDINHADGRMLQALPGIGPALAQRIVAHRGLNGRFREPEGLMEVEGIGPKRFEKLKPWIEAR